MLMLLDSLSHGKLRLNTKCLLYMYDALFAALNCPNCRRKHAKMWKVREKSTEAVECDFALLPCHLNHIYRVRYPCINLRINCVSFNVPFHILVLLLPFCDWPFYWRVYVPMWVVSILLLCSRWIRKKSITAGKWRGSPFVPPLPKIQRIW